MTFLSDNWPLIIVYGLSVCCLGTIVASFGLLIYEIIEETIHLWRTK